MLRTPALPSSAPPAPAPLPGTPARDTAVVAPSMGDGHRARLQELLRIEAAREETRPRRRGRQPPARQCLQQHIRQVAVDCYHPLHDQGLTLAPCGQALQLPPRTLRAWDADGRAEPLRLLPVGRPVTRSPLPVRQAILDYLKLTGPGVGVATLQDHFGDVARGELADLLARYRAVYRARHPQCPRVLHWQTPGRVWAADFTAPSRYGLAGLLPPIAGCYS
jgi:hypothetical protein